MLKSFNALSYSEHSRWWQVITLASQRVSLSLGLMAKLELI